jgi:DNA (cytosine-5)-methyltransferase 1
MTFKFIDLFAGIGGIRIPFEEYGGECVFSSEWDKFAQQTYASNHGHLPHGDITQIDPKHIPKFDLLLAGFPCQPFSHAGLKKGFDDTRGTLFFDIARIIAHHKPKAVFLENVKGLVGHDKGRTFQTIVRVLEDELGYQVHYKVHNAKEFGVPQNRERIYIVALRDHDDFEFLAPPKPETRLGDILESNSKVDSKYTISDRIWASHQARKAAHLERGNGFGYSIFSRNAKYTSTISARYYKDGSEILIEQKNKNPRKLTPREAARLQGFPENFVIPVSDGQAYKQFGNSVAVPAIRSVAKALAPILGGRKRAATWKPTTQRPTLFDA